MKKPESIKILSTNSQLINRQPKLDRGYSEICNYLHLIVQFNDKFLCRITVTVVHNYLYSCANIFHQRKLHLATKNIACFPEED